jgi:hypothetical protein
MANRDAMYKAIVSGPTGLTSTIFTPKVEGRQLPTVYGTKDPMVRCTLKCKKDRETCKHWSKNRQSGDCLYLLESMEDACWLGMTRPF